MARGKIIPIEKGRLRKAILRDFLRDLKHHEAETEVDSEVPSEIAQGYQHNYTEIQGLYKYLMDAYYPGNPEWTYLRHEIAKNK